MIDFNETPFLNYLRAKKLYEDDNKDWLSATANRIVKMRKWIVSKDLIIQAINQDTSKYPVRVIPKELGRGFEGGAIMFPIYSPEECMSLAQIRFVHPEQHQNTKCITSERGDHTGPIWYGMFPHTLETIVIKHQVLIVEGPFDVLACKIVLGNDFPVISALGNKLSILHQQDLILIGVHRVYLMFDSDEQGRNASADLTTLALPFEVKPFLCPAKDPSDALQNEASLKTLTNLLRKHCRMP